MYLLPAALRAAQTCRYLVYSEANFEVFHPEWRRVALMGVKFGMDQGRIPCAIFTKLAEFVRHFKMRWVLKFGWICSRGYGAMGVLS